MSQCVSSLPLPHWFPLAVSIGIAVLSFIIIFIAYWYQERQLRKTFYGITDEMEEHEREQQHHQQKQEEEEDLIPHAKARNEQTIVQSNENHQDPHSLAKTPGGAVKVFKRQLHRATSKPALITSREASQTAVSRQSTSPIMPDGDYKWSIQYDFYDFGFLIIQHLKTIIFEEVFVAKRHTKTLTLEAETKIGENIIAQLHSKLEELTNNSPWICHGRLMNISTWVVNGHDHLLGIHSDLKMLLKITIEQPISIVLIGYRIDYKSSSRSCTTPAPQTPGSKIRLSNQLAPTPVPTEPLAPTPVKNSKASVITSSALKRIKTAEAIMYPPRTPVTKPVTSIAPVWSPTRQQPTPIPTTTTTTTQIPKKSSSRKAVQQTPKLPRTPKRSPPNVIPTPQPSSTPASKPPGTATPKACTPVLQQPQKTTVSPNIPTTGTTTAATINTVIPAAATTTAASKTPKLIHGKKTRSDDTQISDHK